MLLSCSIEEFTFVSVILKLAIAILHGEVISVERLNVNMRKQDFVVVDVNYVEIRVVILASPNVMADWVGAIANR